MRVTAYPAALLCLLALGAPADAQEQKGLTVVAVPPLATPKRAQTPAGETGVLVGQIAQVIASDLRSSGAIVPLGPDGYKMYSYPEATAPNFRQWRQSGAKGLVTGFVDARADGRLTVGCYVHDIASGRELGRVGFAVAPNEWRRAAHRCADTVMLKLTGRSGAFDTRLAYVAESGAPANLIKRIAVMDADGSSHRYLTAGDTLVLTPRLSPDGNRIAYVSFAGGKPHVRLLDVESGDDRAALPGDAISFAPRFSPDGRRLLLSIAQGGNSDIFVMKADGGGLQRLTATPGADVSASFSPDGQRIAFVSDRSGTAQLYTMNADGSGVRRLSFGGVRYGAPAWSPDGETIAFTRIDGSGMRIATMSATGGAEKLLTNGPGDEGPSWSGSGGNILFQRAGPRSGLFIVPAGGGDARPLTTPQGGSDPDWSAGGAR